MEAEEEEGWWNALLFSLMVGHLIALQRFAAQTTRKVISFLNRADADIQEQIHKNSWEDVSRPAAKQARLDKMLVSIQEVNATAYKQAVGALQADMLDLAEYEVEWQKTAVEKASSGRAKLNRVPSPAELRAATFARPFQGRNLKEWSRDLEDAAFKRVRDTIRIGFLEGQSVADIARKIRGTAGLRFADGVTEANRRGAESLVHTALAHYSNSAREELFKRNSDQIRHLRWVSVLDGRTTLTCINRSGKVFPVGVGPRPPAHWRCRSVMVPELVGSPPFEGETYASWFKKQSAAEQDDIIGVAKGKLYRAGGMALDRFTDKSGKILTLQQLRKKDADAFTRAGL